MIQRVLVGSSIFIDLAIEIDGKRNHSTPQAKERDTRKNKAIEQTGIANILRVEFEVPADLVYGKIKNANRRKYVKKLYLDFVDNWMKGLISTIEGFPDVEKLNHSVLLSEKKVE